MRAVDDLSFDVEAGKVTGFLGPNGAGKSTTMRMMMGLDRPDRRARRRSAAGATATWRPRCARWVPCSTPGRCTPAAPVASHLRIGGPHQRHPAVAGRGGASTRSASARAAGRRVKGYSLGMCQRLGIAAALLGDPRVLLFDEPVNGLDLDGVRWIRALLRGFADEGRTVLVSSHLMSEMQLVADRVVVIGRGRLIADADDRRACCAGWAAGGCGCAPRAPTTCTAPSPSAGTGASQVERTGAGRAGGQRPARPPRSGTLAHALGLPVHHLADVEQSLEHAYLSLTQDSVEHHGHSGQRARHGRSDPMSTTTSPPADHRATLARAGRAEWSRIWSVRSSWILALRDRGAPCSAWARSSGSTRPATRPGHRPTPPPGTARDRARCSRSSACSPCRS